MMVSGIVGFAIWTSTYVTKYHGGVSGAWSYKDGAVKIVAVVLGVMAVIGLLIVVNDIRRDQ